MAVMHLCMYLTKVLHIITVGKALVHVHADLLHYGVVELPAGGYDAVAAAHDDERHIKLALVGRDGARHVDVDGDVGLGPASLAAAAHEPRASLEKSEGGRGRAKEREIMW